MNRDLLNLVQSKMSSFSKGQRLIGQFIIEHYDKAAFMTAAKLGTTVGVSESTVVRFASEIGYEGYPQLQRALQEMIRNRLTSVQRMEVTSDQIGDSDVLTKVLNQDIEKIRRTLEETSKQDFNQAVDAIVAARRIYILGVRSSSALARFLSVYFHYIFDNVTLIDTTSSSEMFEQILRIGRQDVFIVMSFPRYSKKAVQASDYAYKQGATVVAVTDSAASPIADYSTHLLLARSDMASFVDSLVAPLSIINALIVAVGLKKKSEIANTFSRLEGIWEEANVYETLEAHPKSDREGF